MKPAPCHRDCASACTPAPQAAPLCRATPSPGPRTVPWAPGPSTPSRNRRPAFSSLPLPLPNAVRLGHPRTSLSSRPRRQARHPFSDRSATSQTGRKSGPGPGPSPRLRPRLLAGGRGQLPRGACPSLCGRASGRRHAVSEPKSRKSSRWPRAGAPASPRAAASDSESSNVGRRARPSRANLKGLAGIQAGLCRVLDVAGRSRLGGRPHLPAGVTVRRRPGRPGGPSPPGLPSGSGAKGCRAATWRRRAGAGGPRGSRAGSHAGPAVMLPVRVSRSRRPGPVWPTVPRTESRAGSRGGAAV